MRLEALQPLTGGINRLRNKGGANPRQLYDLLNGYVAQDGSVVSRPGTVKVADLPAGTKGLCAANGVLNVFSDSPKEGMPDGVECTVLRHPTLPGLTLHDIPFAGPFLGDAHGALLYVVAEFNNGDVFHYWTRSADTWEADTAYQPGSLVQPSTPNGYLYRARRAGAAHPAWQAGVNRSVGDIVEPTTSNGYYYEVIEVADDPTPSGSVEPTWPIGEGGVVTEYSSDSSSGTSGTTPTDPSGSTVPGGVGDRYGCVVLDTWIQHPGAERPAGLARVGGLLELADQVTLEADVGEIERAEPSLQPCVLVTCANGVELECSESAPIATRDSGYVLAPQLIGHMLPTRVHGAAEISVVVGVRSIGMRWVMELTVGNRAFWAGKHRGLQLLHHNAKNSPSDPEFAPESLG